MDSHELFAAISQPRSTAARSGSVAARRQNEINSSRVFATRTTEPKFRTTSGTAELTIGRPAAKYSSALVGLMNSVASFSANGIRQTSNALQYAGRSA